MVWFGLVGLVLLKLSLSWIRVRCREWVFGIGRREIRLWDRGAAVSKYDHRDTIGETHCTCWLYIVGGVPKKCSLDLRCSLFLTWLQLESKHQKGRLGPHVWLFWVTGDFVVFPVSGHFPYSVAPLRHLIRVMGRHDLAEKDLPTYIPSHLPSHLPTYLPQRTPLRRAPRDLCPTYLPPLENTL